MEVIDLSLQWRSLLKDSGLSQSVISDRAFSELTQAYTQRHRYYHNLSHIEQMLSWLEKAGISNIEVRWATWYHDFVYVPGKSSNEKLSAKKACTVLLDLGMSSQSIKLVSTMILATKTHQAGDASADEVGYLLDADMAILGVQAHKYQDYCRAVENEFKWIPDFIYRRGRKQFLQAVLAQERIYISEWFNVHLESQARINIKQELAAL